MQNPAGYSSLRRIGDFKHSARIADHDGWVLCDGRNVKKATYPRLFMALNVTAATLTLPDAKDCLLVGAGGRLKVMERGGSNQIVLTIENLPEHDHGYTDSYEEPAVATGGLLAGVLKLMNGLTAKSSDKRTSKAGQAKPAPLKVEPLAIGANVFIYVGEPVA